MSGIYVSTHASVPCKWVNQYDFFCVEPKITKYTALNAQLSFGAWESIQLWNFNLRLSWKEDHGGLNIELGLLGLWIVLGWYDIRHWNDDTNDWEKYE
jgi:hypothetical protein